MEITKLTKREWLLPLISLAVIVPFMAPYFTLDPARSRIEVGPDGLQFPVLVAHIATAFVALVLGFIQLLEPLRRSRPGLHRRLGRGYAMCVLLSGLLALIVTAYITDFGKAVSFITLSLLWLFTTLLGVRAARRRQWEAHRRWMYRSFAFTLVAVSGRLLVPLLLLLLYAALHGFALPGGREAMVEAVLNVNIWAGLVLNLIVTEWLVLGRSRGA
ncbi:DUF2306 domain-containing protein [Paenibacillus athensensis]|uniref:DUF2306 domain-containing protein n=1 Tax=Paenibacillus athensensis TaxID=1967502 RepID=A0A4Y8PTD2_9BACL|nr:DUF2306 domain-containing protein [Paenibacillus athensensis]MCD1257262.1 DUF2306 domain-containing protein [Paenibacillus athensensis]